MSLEHLSTISRISYIASSKGISNSEIYKMLEYFSNGNGQLGE